jgi:hypothetical protein
MMTVAAHVRCSQDKEPSVAARVVPIAQRTILCSTILKMTCQTEDPKKRKSGIIDATDAKRQAQYHSIKRQRTARQRLSLDLWLAPWALVPCRARQTKPLKTKP